MPWPNACQVLYKQTLLSPDLEESFLTGMAGQVQTGDFGPPIQAIEM